MPFKDPEKKRAEARKWRANHLEQARALKQRWNAANPEKAQGFIRAWHAAHPDHARASNSRRRARKKLAPICDFTAVEWQFVKVWFGHRCFYCGKDGLALAQEHMIPLSRGGSHTADNIVPACRTCNSRKGTKTAEEFLSL